MHANKSEKRTQTRAWTPSVLSHAASITSSLQDMRLDVKKYTEDSLEAFTVTCAIEANIATIESMSNVVEILVHLRTSLT